MSAKREERERADRDRERSKEAHWRAAEAGAEEEDRPSASPDQADGPADKEGADDRQQD
jgi:hypothetical protein